MSAPIPETRPDRRIREAEGKLFADAGLHPREIFLDLPSVDLRLRVLSVGAGTPLVMLHGVGLSAAVWVPWLGAFSGYRTHLVELPGHGLSDPVTYRVGGVREHSLHLMDDLFNALGLGRVPVVGHSLGGMFALWYAAGGRDRISSLVAIGEPAVALPGARVRMPLSLLTVPGLGRATLRSPTPRPVYRWLLGQGLSPAAAADAPEALVDVLRFGARRKGNARTVATLMHAIDHFRRARGESVLSEDELRAISVPTLFCVGTDDPFLPPAGAEPSIAKIDGAELREVRGGHAPWLEDPEGCAKLVLEHLAQTGYPSVSDPSLD